VTLPEGDMRKFICKSSRTHYIICM